MKARVKETGEIVELDFNPNIDRWVDITRPANGVIYRSCEIDEYFSFDEPITASFDWGSFRNETVAKLFLVYDEFQPYNESNFATAINRTDELINQLKPKP